MGFSLSLRQSSRDQCFEWSVRSQGSSEARLGMQKVIPHCLSFRRLIIKITVNIFWRWDLPIYPCCCWVGCSFFSLFHFFSQHSHTSLELKSVKAIMVIGSEMIFCSHSARHIGVDVIHLGCRPCCKCIILPQPHSTRLCTQRFTFPGLGVSAL